MKRLVMSNSGQLAAAPTDAYVLTQADIDGANSGQRPDLIGDKETIYERADGTLFQSDGSSLLAAQAAGGNLLYPDRGQVRWGSYGDSIARITAGAFHDLRRVTADTSMTHERAGAWINAMSNGLLRPVFDGGVSGETTTQMLAREAAGATANRRAIADAAGLGVQFIVNSFGINDIATLVTAATPVASYAAIVEGILERCRGLLLRQAAAGMWPVTHSLLGYSPAGADSPARRLVLQQVNAALRTLITSGGGALGSFVDVHSLVADATGAWLPGFSTDGVHPTTNACRVLYRPITNELLRVSGATSVPLLAYGQRANLYNNSTFLTQNGGAGAGTGTGVGMYIATGTATTTQRILAWRGRNWQEFVVTPTALDGNGNVAINVDVTYTSADILAGDVIGGDASLYIDDASGGAPDVFTFMARLRAAGVFSVMPAFSLTPPTKVRLTAPVDHTTAFVPIVAPSAAPASTILTFYAAADSLRPFRMRIALPRAFKLPADY